MISYSLVYILIFCFHVLVNHSCTLIPYTYTNIDIHNIPIRIIFWDFFYHFLGSFSLSTDFILVTGFNSLAPELRSAVFSKVALRTIRSLSRKVKVNPKFLFLPLFHMLMKYICVMHVKYVIFQYSIHIHTSNVFFFSKISYFLQLRSLYIPISQFLSTA